jgi:hypothetical protein
MRRLLALSCRTFPPDHRARQSDEVVDTALLVANGSVRRMVREAFSLVVAGLRERLHAESHRSAREGLTLLAGSLALVNLSVALAGMLLAIRPPFVLPAAFTPHVDWWWIAFAAAAAAVVLGLVLGDRRLTIGAAVANLGVVGYDAVFLADNSTSDARGHMDVFSGFGRMITFPAERQWFAVAVVLALASLATPVRRLPLRRMGLAPVIVLLLVVLSRVVAGGFAFLAWPTLALVVLGIVFGAVAPRVAVVAIGLTLAAVASADTYLTTAYLPAPAGLPRASDGFVTWVVAVGLTLGVLLPLAQLARRRLT